MRKSNTSVLVILCLASFTTAKLPFPIVLSMSQNPTRTGFFLSLIFTLIYDWKSTQKSLNYRFIYEFAGMLVTKFDVAIVIIVLVDWRILSRYHAYRVQNTTVSCLLILLLLDPMISRLIWCAVSRRAASPLSFDVNQNTQHFQ